MYVYTTSLSVHLSVDGHLGCFHVLAVVNSVAVNARGMYLFELEFCDISL